MNNKVFKFLMYAIIIVFFIILMIYILYHNFNIKTKYIRINLGDSVENCTIQNGKIAPGTSGNFSISIKAKKNLNYSIESSVISENNPKFCFKVDDSKKVYTDIKKLFEENFNEKISRGEIITKKIIWYWDYESEDLDFLDRDYIVKLKLRSSLI